MSSGAGIARVRSPGLSRRSAARLARLDWPALRHEIHLRGYAVTPSLLSARECSALAALYADEARFRSTIVMQRHGFGAGEYRYFDYPLPPLVETLRRAVYPELAPLANEWQVRLNDLPLYPPTLAAFLAECHARGQTRPTPLLLRYGQDDFNCLHRDLYGELAFPLQLTLLLSRPGEDFAGGEFVLVEQRPRRQSRAEVVPLELGQAVIFAVNERPVAGPRGYYRSAMRHGVSRVRAGSRHTLGIIFHDAS